MLHAISHAPKRLAALIICPFLVTALTLVAADPVEAQTVTVAAQSLTASIQRGAVITLHWRQVPGATGYELFQDDGGGVTVTRPLASYRVRQARARTRAGVTVLETSGYQELGAVAGSGASASGTSAALLSPLRSLALSAAPLISTTQAHSDRLGAGVTSASVRNGEAHSTRYGVAAIVDHRLVPLTRVTATSVASTATAASATVAGQPTIDVDTAETYQTMQGFGGTLTDSSAYELSGGVADASPTTLEAEPGVRDLFSPTAGIGLSYVRVSIGGNDFSQANYAAKPSLSNEYTEDDPAPGSTATSFTAAQLTAFIAHDLNYQVPVLKAAVALNPALKIMATPWTAPVWMKCENTDAESGAGCQSFDPDDLQALLSGNPGYAGGTLNPAFVSQYADYLLEFILAYRAEGLTVNAVSLGNEPANGTWAYPSMEMSPAIEADVAGDLSADLTAAHLSATIIGLDHNWNTTYPQGSAESCGSDCYATQLAADAKPGTVGAIGFHCYGGDPSAQDDVTLAIYETECAPLGAYTASQDSSLTDLFSTAPASFARDLLWDTEYLVINGLRDGDSGGVSGAGSETVMLWDLVANSSYGPTINAGCTTSDPSGACLPVEELDNPDQPTYEVGYYLLGQLSRFITPGAQRIGSSETGDLETVAFQDRDGTDALVVLDDQPVDCSALVCTQPSGSQPFTVDADGRTFSASIPAGAVQTYTWHP